MAVELILSPEALADVAEAYAWYENQRVGRGEEFLGCVDACLQSIRRSPLARAVVYKTYRRGVVRRFPYVVFYEHEDERVTVYCVFHASRDPQKWRQRLP
jgi:plasmid stabilization system protein ParE